MKTLVVASANKGKLKEIEQIFGKFYNVIPMAELGFNKEIEENGKTFFENALIKAKTVCEALNVDALADDSGLAVDALNGAPGIYSARFSGTHGNDYSNRQLLLKKLDGITNRNAKFISSVVLYKTDGTYIEGYGETNGTILFKEDGENGFGYDSLFLSDDLKKSFGVATAEEKNSVSHRYRALIDLYSKIK